MASRGAPLLSELVVDASIIVAALLDDEHQPIADRVLRHVGEAGGLAPRLWQLETRSALISAEHRGRATEARVDELLVVLKGLPVKIDGGQSLEETLALARTHKLSFYDATYLELARRSHAILATLDSELAQAALGEGLQVL